HSPSSPSYFFFSLLTHPAPPQPYSLSLHDALPILDPMLIRRTPRERTTRTSSVSASRHRGTRWSTCRARAAPKTSSVKGSRVARSEEHTSELQSHLNIVCRLLLEKKKTK